MLNQKIDQGEYKILHVEDSIADSDQIKWLLKKTGINYHYLLATDEKSFRVALNQFNPDVILCDHTFPNFNSTLAFEIVQEQKLTTPFILVTGTVSEEFAVEMMRKGVADYLLKTNLQRLPLAIVQAIEKKVNDAYLKKLQLELQLSESQLRTIFNNATVGLILLDTKGVIIQLNELAKHFIKISSEQSVKANHNLLNLYKKRKNIWSSYIERALTGESFGQEFLYAKENLKIRSFYISFNPVKYKLSKLVGSCITIEDITERKNTEIQLKKLNEDLQQQTKLLKASNEWLEHFAYVASHDLQEPLRMVNSYLNLLKKNYDPHLDEKGKKYIAYASDGAIRMRQIIADLLEFSRVGKTNHVAENIQLNKLVNEVIQLFKKEIKEKKALFKIGPLPTIHYPSSPIRQVFQNLISNAIKYCPPNQSPQINISSKELEDFWQISISDNGIGIDPQFHQSIFQIFHRLHTKEEYPGTGMGLAITKKIIENLGGIIFIESELGKGASFHFTIKK
jgi:PAS domain S-box-containing protein